MSSEEIRGLPVTVDIMQAGKAFGLGRTKAYELAKTDEFPCPVLKVGARYRVAKVHLLRAVGLEPNDDGGHDAAQPESRRAS